MQLPYSDVLDIAHFSRLFDNKSECYKLFWFQAIARKIKEGYEIITFEALIDEMIADAWYMVSEYHLNLGPNDTLEKVKKYWKMIVAIKPVYEIYGEKPLNEKNISIDHFVPWSYVAHDELWNLTPTTRSINSSKSNSLSDWNSYFPMLYKSEYLSYKLMWEYSEIHTAFEKCAKEHLNNQEIKYKLYQKGLSEKEFSRRLEDDMFPVYQSAKNMGFSNWSLRM